MQTLEGINIDHDNFIGKYEKLITSEECDIVIDFFDQFDAVQGHYQGRRKQTGGRDHLIKDSSVGFDDLVYGWKRIEQTLNSEDLERGLHAVHSENGILTKLYDAFNEYVSRYSIMGPEEPWMSRSFKLQKTQAGDGSGYHIWHSEYAAGQHQDRFAAWILYLNDVEEGGETEFLYQSKRVKASMGDLIVWPAFFTHPHRGNPPLKGDKYVMTGWLQIR